MARPYFDKTTSTGTSKQELHHRNNSTMSSQDTLINQASMANTEPKADCPTSKPPISSEAAAEVPAKPQDLILLKEQQVMGMLSADGSTRKRSLVMPDRYISDGDDDEEERSYRDPNDEHGCLICGVM